MGDVVAPGFIDMLGQSETSLLIDNRSLSKISQGITTEITGEGGSIAPQDDADAGADEAVSGSLSFDRRLDGSRRIFRAAGKIGHATEFGNVCGRGASARSCDWRRRPRTDGGGTGKDEGLVAQAMQQGAMGVSTALIYPPGHYAKTG